DRTNAQAAPGRLSRRRINSLAERGVVQGRRRSCDCRSERVAGSHIIASRRSNIAHLGRPGRASSLEDQTQRSALFVAIIVRKRRMATEIHAVMQEAPDVTAGRSTDAVHQEVTPAAAMPGDVQGAQARPYLIPGLGPGNVRTIRKFADR